MAGVIAFPAPALCNLVAHDDLAALSKSTLLFPKPYLQLEACIQSGPDAIMPRVCRECHLCVQLAGDKLLDLAGSPDVCRLDRGQAGEGPAQVVAHKVGVAIGPSAALL